MLVLTRNANQSIMIGHDIVVTVLEIRGDQVRLAFERPAALMSTAKRFMPLCSGQPHRCHLHRKNLSALGNFQA